MMQVHRNRAQDMEMSSYVGELEMPSPTRFTRDSNELLHDREEKSEFNSELMKFDKGTRVSHRMKFRRGM